MVKTDEFFFVYLFLFPSLSEFHHSYLFTNPSTLVQLLFQFWFTGCSFGIGVTNQRESCLLQVIVICSETRQIIANKIPEGSCCTTGEERCIFFPSGNKLGRICNWLWLKSWWKKSIWRQNYNIERWRKVSTSWWYNLHLVLITYMFWFKMWI